MQLFWTTYIKFGRNPLGFQLLDSFSTGKGVWLCEEVRHQFIMIRHRLTGQEDWIRRLAKSYKLSRINSTL